MKRLLPSLTLVFASHASPASAAPPDMAPAPSMPATAQEWRAAALRDIEAGYRVTLANHAGARDPHNPAFLGQLDAAKAHGLALAARVKDAAGYQAALLGFSNRIGDGHAGVYPARELEASRPLQWPGFVAAWRGALLVHSAQDGAARPGERILSCDGKPARQLLEENVFGYLGRIKEEGQWWSESGNLFLDAGNPFVARPQRCLFELAGKRTERSLDWRPLPDVARAWLETSVNGELLPVGLGEPRPGLFWMAMPSFKPSDQERAAYRAVYQKVQGERSRFLQADAIVVDLRGNSGGNSQWSRDFAAALWGEARVNRWGEARDSKEEVWYRASPGNIAYFEGLVDKFTAQGETALVQALTTLVTGLRAAAAANQAYHVPRQKSAVAALEPQAHALADQPGDPAPFTRPVYVIVPGNCASACLDAVDVFKLFPNTRLVGAPSSADSTYMEVRNEKLPGGLARVLLPTKLYVNRPRGNGEFYRPDIPVTALQWTRANFLDAIERDLARTAGKQGGWKARTGVLRRPALAGRDAHARGDQVAQETPVFPGLLGFEQVFARAERGHACVPMCL